MIKLIIPISMALLISGCETLPQKQCSAIANIGGQETTVAIYGVRKQVHQTQYYAGNPFGWKWVSKNNFISSTCDK